MRKILKNTVLLSILTFSSRVLGVVRDAFIAMYFGTTSQSDAFFIAFRPFDLVRKLFSEGILSISFVPVFSKTLEKDGHSKAVALAFSFFCFLSLAGVLIVMAGIFLWVQVALAGDLPNYSTESTLDQRYIDQTPGLSPEQCCQSGIFYYFCHKRG